VGSNPTRAIMNREQSEESRRELDAYRAYEMARSGSIDLNTIYKSTGGYGHNPPYDPQGIADVHAAANIAKKKKKEVEG
jgi:hypothetical protein